MTRRGSLASFWRVPGRLAALAGLLAAALGGTAARGQQARMFLGTFADGGTGNGRVYRYEGGTTWTDLSPPGGLADAVWDLEWINGTLWAATMDGWYARVPNPQDLPHGSAGHVMRFDGTTWTDLSPPGGFDSAVTTLSVVDGVAYATVDQDGLYRYDGGRHWTLVGGFVMGGQAIVSSTHDGHPMIYMGQDDEDVFFFHDPQGLVSCPPQRLDPSGMPACSPVNMPTGQVCSGDCLGGSCIHAFSEFDDGSGVGALVYAGAFEGRMYRWERTEHRFVRIDDVPFVRTGNWPHENVHGLAWYHGLLWVGLSNGDMFSTPDATAPTYHLERAFGDPQPVSDMLAVPQDDLLWVGFGAVPYRWSRHDGFVKELTYDGVRWQDRTPPSGFANGVLSQLAVWPEVSCDAGPEQTVECQGALTAVTLDGSASHVPGALGLPLTASWTGPFVEGHADGLTPTVHFAGVGDYTVTLTVTAGTASATCETRVHVVDTIPPALAGMERCLWPPDHRYHCFTVADLTLEGVTTATDVCDGSVAIHVVDARSSQPEDQVPGGDGHTQDDILFDADHVCVWAERLGTVGAGRDYIVTLAAVDASGNAATATAIIHVPHDQREARRCEFHPVDPGYLPHAGLPLAQPAREGTYPPPAGHPR